MPTSSSTSQGGLLEAGSPLACGQSVCRLTTPLLFLTQEAPAHSQYLETVVLGKTSFSSEDVETTSN